MTEGCSERELFGPDTVVQEGTRVAAFEEHYTYTLFLQHVPTAMNRDSQDTPEVRV